MTQVKKGDVYKIKIPCFLGLKADFFLKKKMLLFRKGELIEIFDVSNDTLTFEIYEQIWYTSTEEIIDLIEEGFLSLENKTMTTNTTVDNTDRSKIKYRIIHILRSLLIENEYQSINEQLATWKISPKTFNVSVYGDIDWKDPGNYEKAISLIADKIVGE